MWTVFPFPFLRLSLLIQGPRTTMEAVLPCPLAAGLGQSPVAYIKHEHSAFSVKGFSHVTFAISLYLEALHSEYHTLAHLHMTSARMTYVSVPFVCRRTISPSFGCQSSSLAFVLIRRFSSPYRPGFRNLLTGLYPPPRRQRHATTILRK